MEGSILTVTIYMFGPRITIIRKDNKLYMGAVDVGLNLSVENKLSYNAFRYFLENTSRNPYIFNILNDFGLSNETLYMFYFILWEIYNNGIRVQDKDIYNMNTDKINLNNFQSFDIKDTENGNDILNKLNNSRKKKII